MITMIKFRNIVAAIILSSGLIGCSALQNANSQQKGTGIGAAGGAVIGGIIGNQIGDGNSVLGAIIGGAIGGTAGNIIGNKMDRQAEAIEVAVPGAEVTRVGEGINVTFDENSGVQFQINSDALSPSSMVTLDKMVEVFTEFPDTKIRIEGHTDDSGRDEYNMELSRKRAESVASYLSSRGVTRSRISTFHYGETQPKFDNTTEEGRVKNRRVELGILAGDQMIEDAKAGR